MAGTMVTKSGFFRHLMWCRTIPCWSLSLLLAICALSSSQAVYAQGTPAPGTQLAPIRLAATQIAQVPPPTMIPTDVTPFGLTEERGGLLSPDLKFNILQRLPERLWYNVNTEVTNRLETNVFFTKRNHREDYVFRVLPNITLGYNVLKRTSIYCNYFVIKDVFAYHTSLTFPTTMSLSLGFRQDIPLGRKTSAQIDFQARELWQTSHLRQADLIPSISLTHFLNPKTVLFANVLLQMRGREYFVAPTRELDPFYTVGGLYRMGQWTFVASNTFVTNYRSPPFTGSIPAQGNFSMISDYEISHPIAKKTPWAVAFVRAEPVWNWNSNNAPGLSGFDFRLFGGLRVAFAKQAYTAAIEELREQLLESEKPVSGRPIAQSRSKQTPPTLEPQFSAPAENPEELRMFISQPQPPTPLATRI